MSLKESSALVEEAKEREAQLQGRIRSLEKQIQSLTDREQEVQAHDVIMSKSKKKIMQLGLVKTVKHCVITLVKEEMCASTERKAAACGRGGDGQHEAADDGAVSLGHSDSSTRAARQGHNRHPGAV